MLSMPQLLRSALANLKTDNSQGEQYLTDVLSILRSQGHSVAATVTSEENILGVNDRRQLAEAGAILRTRICDEWMLAGVSMVDPTTVWIDRTAELEPDVTLLPNVAITGKSVIRGGAVIGPDCTLHDTVAEHCATVTSNNFHRRNYWRRRNGWSVHIFTSRNRAGLWR